MKYKVFYTEDKFNEIELNNGKIEINGAVANIDWIQLLKNKHHILHNNRSFDIEVLHADIIRKTFAIRVNENIYDLKLQDELDILLDKMGMSASSNQKLDHIKAPMPGLVVDILVEVGQAIQKGDNLLILEAMKMENIIKANGNGIVKAIKINKKDAVEKNQLLIEME